MVGFGNRSAKPCAPRSRMVGSSRARACHPHADWPSISASLAGSSATPTTSSSSEGYLDVRPRSAPLVASVVGVAPPEPEPAAADLAVRLHRHDARRQPLPAPGLGPRRRSVPSERPGSRVRLWRSPRPAGAAPGARGVSRPRSWRPDRSRPDRRHPGLHPGARPARSGPVESGPLHHRDRDAVVPGCLGHRPAVRVAGCRLPGRPQRPARRPARWSPGGRRRGHRRPTSSRRAPSSRRPNGSPWSGGPLAPGAW